MNLNDDDEEVGIDIVIVTVSLAPRGVLPGVPGGVLLTDPPPPTPPCDIPKSKYPPLIWFLPPPIPAATDPTDAADVLLLESTGTGVSSISVKSSPKKNLGEGRVTSSSSSFAIRGDPRERSIIVIVVVGTDFFSWKACRWGNQGIAFGYVLVRCLSNEEEVVEEVEEMEEKREPELDAAFHGFRREVEKSYRDERGVLALSVKESEESDAERRA